MQLISENYLKQDWNMRCYWFFFFSVFKDDKAIPIFPIDQIAACIEEVKGNLLASDLTKI